MSRKTILLCLLGLTLAGLSGCNTAEGFGKDLSQAGDSIQGVFN